MKKIIALLLAFVMCFSVGTVAFATDEVETTTAVGEDVTDTESTDTTVDEETSDEETTEEEPLLGEYDWILDLPFSTVGPALKLAKIILKFAKIYVKLAIIFGIMDKEEITRPIMDLLQSILKDQTGEGTTETPEATEPEVTEPEVTEPAVAA